MAQYLDALDFRSTHETPEVERTVETQSAKPEPAALAQPEPAPRPAWLDAEVEVSVATYHAYQILYYAFIALMTFAGLDKLLHLLSTSEQNVSPAMASFLHMSPGVITFFGGVIELMAAAAVALKPRIGSWVVTVLLWLVVVNQLTISGHYQLVVSNLALSAAGLAFTRLAAECN